MSPCGTDGSLVASARERARRQRRGRGDARGHARRSRTRVRGRAVRGRRRGASSRSTSTGARQVPNYAFFVPAGARLRFGATDSRRARVPRGRRRDRGAAVLGSRATHLVSGIGGLDGRALAAGDVLPLGGSGARRPRAELRRSGCQGGGGPIRVRVLPGPQADRFADRRARGAPIVAVHHCATNPTAWDSGSTGPRLTHTAGARHHLGCDAARRAAGAGIRPARFC